MLNSIIDRIKKNTLAKSLKIFSMPSLCCAQEFLNVVGARYDLERFGFGLVETPSCADVILINGHISEKFEPYVIQAYEEMLAPKYVIAVGVCAAGGGLFRERPMTPSVPVDLYIPGCPPRPEALMYGLIRLQNKIITGSTAGLPGLREYE